MSITAFPLDFDFISSSQLVLKQIVEQAGFCSKKLLIVKVYEQIKKLIHLGLTKINMRISQATLILRINMLDSVLKSQMMKNTYTVYILK